MQFITGLATMTAQVVKYCMFGTLAVCAVACLSKPADDTLDTTLLKIAANFAPVDALVNRNIVDYVLFKRASVSVSGKERVYIGAFNGWYFVGPASSF